MRLSIRMIALFALRLVGLSVLLIAFVLPVAGADEKKSNEPKPVDPKSVEPKKIDPDVKAKEGYVIIGQYYGKVLNVQAAQKALTIQVTNKVAVPNQGAINRIAELKLAMARTTDRNAIRNYSIEMAQQQAKVVTYQDKTQDVPLVAHEEVKVRVSEPPVEFNDQGEKKRHTPEELKKLKGPGNYWGFPAEFEQISVGSNIQAIVSRKKTDPKVKKKDDANEPVVTEIRIMFEMKKDAK